MTPGRPDPGEIAVRRDPGEAAVRRPDREATVRRMMERTPVPVPPELGAEAVRRGERLLWRRRLVHRVLWLLAWAAVTAFTVWSVRTHPWVEPPAQTTPPVTGW